jgi:hypothetical protein
LKSGDLGSTPAKVRKMAAVDACAVVRTKKASLPLREYLKLA